MDGGGKKWRRKRLSLVQLHLNQSSEPDSQTALAHFLNAAAREESGTEKREAAVLPNTSNRCYRIGLLL